MIRRLKSQWSRARRDQSGFTLLELIVVIAIMGIFVAIGTTTLSAMRQNALVKKGGSPTPKPKVTHVASTAPAPDLHLGTIFGVLGIIAGSVVVFTIVGLSIAKMRRNVRAVRAERVTLTKKWDQSVARHMGIKDAYGTLLLDPVAALSYSALWDVTNKRTQAFHEVYARVQDIYNLHTDRCPADPALVEEYASVTRRAETLWADAYRYAKRLGFDWMPPTDKTAARRAAAMLKTAANPAATEAERGAAAIKAKELMDSIGSVTFKTDTLAAVESAARLALNSASSDREAVSV